MTPDTFLMDASNRLAALIQENERLSKPIRQQKPPRLIVIKESQLIGVFPAETGR